VRDMFSAIFFVAIGLLIDPAMLVKYAVPILVITLAVVLGKIVSCSFGAFMGGNDGRTSLRVGMGLAQIGEFSFIIASLGLTLNVTSNFLYPIAVAVSAITTLLTPYLIQASDGVASRLAGWAPRSVVNAGAIYTRWVGQIGTRPSSQVSKWIRQWSAQMALNAALIAAVFIAAAFAGRQPPAWMQVISDEWLRAALWLAAVIVSLPMFIATSRKLQALGLLIAETRVTAAAAGERTAAIRSVVALFIPIAGTLVLGLYVLVLSATLLPSFKTFVVLALIALAISLLLRRSFIRVYAKAQIALTETLAQTPDPLLKPGGAAAAPAPLPSLLREADLSMIELVKGAPALGQRIHELQLRNRTGASIVGIERSGGNVINPGPEEELQLGDQVLILGTAPQLEAARVALLKRLDA
jgi:CPA2 family monovalent cation:H+ antiporter-2